MKITALMGCNKGKECSCIVVAAVQASADFGIPIVPIFSDDPRWEESDGEGVTEVEATPKEEAIMMAAKLIHSRRKHPIEEALGTIFGEDRVHVILTDDFQIDEDKEENDFQDLLKLWNTTGDQM